MQQVTQLIHSQLTCGAVWQIAELETASSLRDQMHAQEIKERGIQLNDLAQSLAIEKQQSGALEKSVRRLEAELLASKQMALQSESREGLLREARRECDAVRYVI